MQKYGWDRANHSVAPKSSLSNQNFSPETWWLESKDLGHSKTSITWFHLSGITGDADSRCLADSKPFTISSQLRNEHQCIFNSEVKLAFRELEHEITQKPLEPSHILVTWAVKKCCLFKWKRLSYISKKCSLFPLSWCSQNQACHVKSLTMTQLSFGVARKEGRAFMENLVPFPVLWELNGSSQCFLPSAILILITPTNHNLQHSTKKIIFWRYLKTFIKQWQFYIQNYVMTKHPDSEGCWDK